MEHMGWSTIALKQRYQHVTDSLGQEIAEKINGYFWKSN
jgi:hypothetical protein